mgnify:CR=1 FL=1
MGNVIRTRAFAKANLSLNVTGKKADGMHSLDSVMMSLDVFDTVTVAERADKEITVRFVNARVDGENTAFKAARAVQRVIGGNGWDITVEKRIPMGAGLGGSSADGAAVLRALDVMYKLPQRGADMRALALSVGSDVPFMLTGGLARVGGVGEDLFFIENKLEIFIVGLMAESVSTSAAYAKFDAMYGGDGVCPIDNDKMCASLLEGDAAALDALGNALYAPAVELAPSIARNARMLAEAGARVNMTGSGGMVLGYFSDVEKFAACARELKNEKGFAVFAPAKTGVLHERL